jgi:hypothetical protein
MPQRVITTVIAEVHDGNDSFQPQEAHRLSFLRVKRDKNILWMT